jgi:hypothetical protein
LTVDIGCHTLQPWIPPLIAAAALNSLALIIGRGSWMHTVGVLSVLLWLCLPILVISGLLFVVGRPYEMARWLAVRAAVAVGVLASTGISAALGVPLAAWDVARAQAHCEKFIPAIEDYKRAHGAYPRDLSFLPRQSWRPYLAGSDCGYDVYQSGAFGFTFSDPRGLMRFVSYGSETGKWSVWQ